MRRRERNPDSKASSDLREKIKRDLPGGALTFATNLDRVDNLVSSMASGGRWRDHFGSESLVDSVRRPTQAGIREREARDVG